MAGNKSSLSMLDWAAQIHGPDCAGFGPAREVAALSLPEGVADEVVAYGLEARQVYNCLKRLIGQVAGLMILLQASGRREVLDLPSIASAAELFDELRERLSKLRTTSRLDVHLQQLISAHRLVGTCLAVLREQQAAKSTPDLAEPLGNLSAAYRHLQSASEDRFGMTMVDFRHSCCNCGAEGRLSSV